MMTGGQGEATDYYLYVTTLNDDACSSGAAAWALPCLFNPATNRPLLGTANLCHAALEQDSDSAAAVLVHELHHALGFTDQLFDKFIDETGQAIPEDKVGGAAEGGVVSDGVMKHFNKIHNQVTAACRIICCF
jgi:hypothetical protein